MYSSDLRTKLFKPAHFYVLSITINYFKNFFHLSIAGSDLVGPELAKLITVGTRVVRGPDWRWGYQVGNEFGENLEF